MGIASLFEMPQFLCGIQAVHALYHKTEKGTALCSSPPLSLSTLLDLLTYCSKGSLHPLFESNAIVMHGILCNEDVIGELPFELQQLQRYRSFRHSYGWASIQGEALQEEMYKSTNLAMFPNTFL